MKVSDDDGGKEVICFGCLRDSRNEGKTIVNKL